MSEAEADPLPRQQDDDRRHHDDGLESSAAETRNDDAMSLTIGTWDSTRRDGESIAGEVRYLFRDFRSRHRLQFERCDLVTICRRVNRGRMNTLRIPLEFESPRVSLVIPDI